MTIEFYSQLANGYQCFSNMYPAQFYLGGFGFYSNEHFFQFSKFIDTDAVWARKIMHEPNPFKVKRMGGDRSHPIRQDWDYIKPTFMKIGLRAKFTTHSNLLRLLQNTKDEILIEAKSRDLYWGYNSRTSQGQNMMGRCLMEVRAELKLL